MVVNLTGHPEYGILPESSARIEVLEPGKRGPMKRKLWEGEVTDSINYNLDEGKYVYLVSKETQPNSNDYIIYVGAFYVGLAKGHEFCEMHEKPGKRFNPVTKQQEDVMLAPQDVTCEVCEPVWTRLLLARPQFSVGRQTTNGVRYKCGYVGCRMQNLTSPLAMVLHEAKHQNIDLLKEPNRMVEALAGGKQVAQAQIAAKKPAQAPASAA